ncbi:cell envelope integrity protein TolA [Nitrosomonas sp.]|uniref:cell envelope integrity protein TolA n=1 Tax=Nitrosomonas sp. TaxID=42353 RepID=UPI001D82D901|nr:cell envelope integrity protein TolA [Nitrosomonas sp.]MBX3617346.1 cell envelope integrity protein TolA [Nitrosomonas sp.]
MKKLLLVLLVTASTLTGCASFIQTKHASYDSINTGISYYLPKRMHRLIVTAENLNAEEELKKFKEAEENFVTANKEAKQLETKMKNLKSIAANTPGDEKAKKTAVEAAQKAEGIYLAAKEIADKAKNDMDTSKNRYDQVKAKKDSKHCNYFIAMSITPQALEPDTQYPFLLKFNNSPLRDDELKIKTTQSGLLTSTDAISSDRTGDIAVEIAKAVAMFGIGGFPAPVKSPVSPFIGIDKKTTGESTNLMKECYPSTMKHDAIVDFGSADDMPIVFRDSSGFAVKADQYVLPPNLKMKIVTPKNAKNLKSIFETDEGLKEASYPLKGHYGILYRRDTTYLTNLWATIDGVDTIITSKQISMPNLSPVTLVPFEYLSLVTTKNNAAFENGMLVSYDTNQPSSALALANLPARVAEGYINALTNFLQLKFNYSSKAIDAVNKEKELADLLNTIKKQVTP